MTAHSQDFSNKGTDFWLGYGYHQVMTGNNGQDMVIYITTDVATEVTIAIPGVGFTQTFAIAANTVFTSPALPKNGAQDSRLQTEGVINRGIHITATNPVVVYAHIFNSSVSGSCVLLPTETLGIEYYSLNFTNSSNSNNANCWFYVVATDPGVTTVEITPSANTIGGRTAGVPFQVTLNQGEIYNVMGTVAGNFGVDLTGSKIKSISDGTNGCKRIGVFSGSGRIFIACPGPGNGATSSDNYMVQAFPKKSWGKRFLTSPTAINNGGGVTARNDYFRIGVADPSTVVFINGVVTSLPLQAGFYYEVAATNQPLLIEADQPIAVAQYTSSQNNCGNSGSGDPEVFYLSSVEQSIDDVLFNSNLLVNPMGPSHYVNVIAPNRGTGLSSFRFDGAVPTQAWNVHPSDPNYSFITINGLGQGGHRIISDSGFNAIAYGFANAESYGYNAGTNVKDLNQQLEIATEYGIENSANTCIGTPFQFKVFFPNSTLGSNPQVIRYDSMKWDISAGSGITPNVFPFVINGSPIVNPDSIRIKNGKEVAWYSVPGQFNIPNAGTFQVTITVYRTSADGCGNFKTFTFPLTASAKPIPTFTANIPGCYLEPTQFTETTPQTPKPTYRHWWQFGDPLSGANNTSTQRNPTHIYTSPGVKTIRFANITTAGCISDTITEPITVLEIPNATMTGNVTVCKDAAPPSLTVNFTDGRAPYRFIYTINGVPQPPIVTPPAATSYTINPATNVAGTFVYEITEVRNDGSMVCVRPLSGQRATVVINPLPTATLTGATSVCLNGTPPTITFTGASATAPYIISYTINGVAQPAITTNNAGIATITQPTGTAGTFTYALTSVRDGSSTTCQQNVISSIDVIVKPLPTATLAANISAVCQNAASPVITFTAANGTAPFTFTYNINGGANLTVSSVTTTATVNVPTTTVGPITYNLVSVLEGSPQACSQAQTGSATVQVNALPTATIAGNSTICLNATEPQITFTGAGSAGPYTFSYRINAGPILTATGNPTATVNVPTTTAGTFNYTLVSVSDGTSTACSQSQSGTATVVVKVLPLATITGTIATCVGAASPLVSFTGSNGTAPYTFVYSLNGGANQTISTTGATSTVTLPAPTTTAGTFAYALVSVTEGSAQACAQAVTGSATITVNPLPTATIAGTAGVCLNGTAPTITFTGANGTAPYTFSYNINGGATQTISTTTGNSVTLSAATTVAGTFTYNLLSVRDASSTLCSQTQAGSAVVTVWALPTMGFNFTVPTCDTNTIRFTDVTNPNVGSLNSWSWNFGDPTSAQNTSTDQNPTHVFTAAGSYVVTLNVTTTNGCSNPTPFTRTVVVNARPEADFDVPEVCINDAATNFPDRSTIPSGSLVFHWWDFGDPGSGANNNSTAVSGSHLYTAIGLYTVKHAVRSAAGCVDTTIKTIFINAADPVSSFDFLNAGTTCSSDSVQLRNLSSVSQGSITKLDIFWDAVGAPTVFETVDVPTFNGITKHKYPTSTNNRTFNVRVIAYSGTICFTSSTRPITVFATPSVRFDSIPVSCYLVAPYNITQGTEIGGVAGAGIYSGNGITNAATGLFNPQLAGVGTHRIVYRFTSASPAACRDSAVRWVTVLDTATARFTFTRPTCDGDAVSFTEQSTAPTGVILANTVWDFGDGSPLENHLPGSTFSHTFPGVNVYNVRMFNTSVAGCRSTTNTTPVTISPVPNPNFTFDRINYCLPKDAVVRFLNSSTISDNSALSFSWNFNDPNADATNPNTSTGLSPTHKYSSVGPFNVTLTATSSTGCFKTFTRALTTVRPQPKASFTINKPSVCIGDDVEFTDTSDPTAGATTTAWNWNLENNVLRTTRTVNYTYGNTGNYAPYLVITNSFGCTSDTAFVPFVVHPYPAVSAGPDLTILEYGSAFLKPTVIGSGLSYLWTPNIYFNNINNIKEAVANLIPSDITYKLTVTGLGGCTAADDVFVKVLRAPQIPNTFTPNNDGINDTWKIEYLSTYPECRVQVFTKTGALVFESRGYDRPWDGTKKGQPLPFDTYYYVLEPGNGRAPLKGYVTIIK